MTTAPVTGPPRWEIQRYVPGTRMWVSSTAGPVEAGVSERALALAALAGHLMTVDRHTDFNDYRAAVRHGLSPAHITITEDDLGAYLHTQGYYQPSTPPPLREVLDQTACQTLPPWLQEHLDRQGTPGPQ
ncbi:hypothetical protein BV881_33260 [Streptomyces sp. ZL-24]|uniref:hypothetical protein n=1 Tax=Streptomyces sp. ZL-24 TaxID=1933029 RepID=UPI000CD3C43A|nr:hypothetical protein [Streptomyces sp. ZL-24]POG43196.1 hypothetical protein BV881_33260 [Streptomyces sp. ZL-24]